jgi:hypothetical protein
VEGDRFGKSVSGVDEVAVCAEHFCGVDERLGARCDVVVAGHGVDCFAGERD